VPRVIRTHAAEDDLWEIVLYIARDNEDAAFRLIDTIDEKFQLLAQFPNAGPHAPSCCATFAAFRSEAI